jgi:cytochrome c oxidase subunit 2
MPFRSAFSSLFTQNVAIAWVVFGLVVVAMAGAMAHSWHRRRKGQGPSRQAEANRVELGYAAALTGMVIFLVISSFAANARDYPDPPKPVARVQVTGYQWCWRFQYAGTGRTSDGQCQGDDPAKLPVLVVRVPYWRFKLYAYPGHVQGLTVTIPRAGQWIGRCAQLCGLDHFEMDFWLRAVPPPSYRAYLRTGRL